MTNEIPCNNCITLASCKSQTKNKSYYGMWFYLKNKCTLFDDYVNNHHHYRDIQTTFDKKIEDW